ncbi:MAG: hypothetical protein CMM04_10375 [Rhodopirellula sp.]|nr:hypothetical protein [Rhodopirellula sp.]
MHSCKLHAYIFGVLEIWVTSQGFPVMLNGRFVTCKVFAQHTHHAFGLWIVRCEEGNLATQLHGPL